MYSNVTVLYAPNTNQTGVLIMPSSPLFFDAADESHVRREKAKARSLRQSPWWKNQLARGRCHYCGSARSAQELTMDHVVPIVRGGRSTRSNVVPCCKDCNSRKSHRVPVEWLLDLDEVTESPPDGAPSEPETKC